MKVAISGTHSVGKTTLLRKIDLAGYVKIPEIPRQVILRLGKLPHEMTQKEFYLFQKELCELQVKAEKEAGENFISDRAIYDFIPYIQELKDKSLVKELTDYVLEHATAYDYIFYLPIKFPLKVDNVRKNSDEFQKIIDERLINLYKKLNIPYVVIHGDRDERVKEVYNIIGI